jgi:hypothetical protein
MLRDLLERAMRAHAAQTTPALPVLSPFRRTRQRRGTITPVQLGVRIVDGERVPMFSTFRATWEPNASIPRFHGSWWTRLRVRTGVANVRVAA